MTRSKRHSPVPAGILVIIGGKENKGAETVPGRECPEGFIPLEILRTFCSLSRKKSGGIQVITSASEKGKASFADYKKAFHDLGYNAVNHIHHETRDEVMQDEAGIEKIRTADAVFFAGGDQLLLTSLYGGTVFLSSLKDEYYSRKIIIGGTSAGAMAFSTPMIYAGEEEVQQVGGEIKVTTGLEFLKDVCVDTHFVHRGRFVRLAQVIATNPGCMGMGIEEDTAVIVREGLKAEVLGSGTVILIRGVAINNFDNKRFVEKRGFSVRNLRVDILASGDKFSVA